jgi:hypothetical protein
MRESTGWKGLFQAVMRALARFTCDICEVLDDVLGITISLPTVYCNHHDAFPHVLRKSRILGVSAYLCEDIRQHMSDKCPSGALLPTSGAFCGIPAGKRFHTHDNTPCASI